MVYAKYENYYIREEELLIVLAGADVSTWVSITSEDRDSILDVTKEDIYRILANLYKKSYVEWEDESVLIQEPVNSLVKVLKNAKGCLSIEGEEEKIELRLCYYTDEKIAVLEKSKAEREMLRFSLWEPEVFMDFLWEIGIFPEVEFETNKEEKSSECLKVLDEKDRMIRGQIALRDLTSGMVKSAMKIEEEGMDVYVIIEEGDEKTEELYQKTKCQDVILKWIK